MRSEESVGWLIAQMLRFAKMVEKNASYLGFTLHDKRIFLTSRLLKPAL
jgi:hypothetical protein